MIWELVAYATDKRDDVRWRAYTDRRQVAEAFKRIPRIDFSDSGHGIVFASREMDAREKRRQAVQFSSIAEHIRRHAKGAVR